MKYYLLIGSALMLAACGQAPNPNGPNKTQAPKPEKEEERASTSNSDWTNLEMVPIEIPEDANQPPARNFYFIFDGSGSMNDPTNSCEGPQQFATKMEGAVWALNQFIEVVPNEVKIGLYAFDNYGQRERLILAENNRANFLKAVSQLKAGGKTPLAKAIRFGTDQLVDQYKKQMGYGEFRLVVITDGAAEDLPEAARYAASHGIPIYTIGLCIGKQHPLRHYSVSYQAANNFNDLAASLESTLAELPQFQVTDFVESP